MLTNAAVAAMAADLLRGHGLSGWRFALDNARERIGACHFHARKITLSRHFIRANAEADIREAILHEIAHALVGPGHGHDATWKATAARIGAAPQRLADDHVQMPKPKWALYCAGCDSVVAERHRRVMKLERVYCANCGLGGSELSWREASALGR